MKRTQEDVESKRTRPLISLSKRWVPFIRLGKFSSTIARKLLLYFLECSAQ
jgi:hypothetical protein